MTVHGELHPADSYKRVESGERCPRCGEPGYRTMVRDFAGWRPFFVHATTGHGIGGCGLENIDSGDGTR